MHVHFPQQVSLVVHKSHRFSKTLGNTFFFFTPNLSFCILCLAQCKLRGNVEVLGLASIRSMWWTRRYKNNKNLYCLVRLVKGLGSLWQTTSTDVITHQWIFFFFFLVWFFNPPHLRSSRKDNSLQSLLCFENLKLFILLLSHCCIPA